MTMDRQTQWLIERATRAMLFWVEEAERLDATYARRMAEEAERALSKGLRTIDGKVSFAGTAECKDLISNGVWAHRKIRTYTLTVQALCARASVLGSQAMPLDVGVSQPRQYSSIYEIDRTPGLQPGRHKPHPWSWGLRHGRNRVHSA